MREEEASKAGKGQVPWTMSSSRGVKMPGSQRCWYESGSMGCTCGVKHIWNPIVAHLTKQGPELCFPHLSTGKIAAFSSLWWGVRIIICTVSGTVKGWTVFPPGPHVKVFQYVIMWIYLEIESLKMLLVELRSYRNTVGPNPAWSES